MKKIITFVVCYLIIATQGFSQNTFPSSGAVGIGTTSPNTSSVLEIKSTTQGLLIPRMTKNQRDAIGSPINGLMIFQTNSTPGFYYYDGSKWVAISPKGVNKSLSNLANVAVNTDLLPGTNGSLSLGSSSNAWKNLYLTAPVFVNGKQTAPSVGDANDNILIGTGAGFNISTGIENIAVGNSALNQNQAGDGNVAIGKGALFINSASGNTAVGDQAMVNNTNGYWSCSFGYQALYSNVSGISNSAFGYKSLYSNSGSGLNGIFNSAFGSLTLYTNTTGSYNSAYGTSALHNNSSGSQNDAFGYDALVNNTTGNQNVSIGSNTLEGNTTGSWNTAVGYSALYPNTAQDKNTAIGWSAGHNSVQSSASTYLGFNAHATVVVSGSMALGVNAVVTASNQVRIGTNAITSIGGFVNWSNISDGRVKKNIKQNVPGLSFINQLKPVTYNLDLDAADRILQTQQIKDAEGKIVQPTVQESTARKAKEQIIYTGFVAQDVEKTAKQIGYDFSGVDAAKNDKDLYGLRYSDFVVPLVKAVQELSIENDSLKQSNTALQ
ncbi:MAG: tail fiber domain-containing protein, partial [Parafilimonas sp.]